MVTEKQVKIQIQKPIEEEVTQYTTTDGRTFYKASEADGHQAHLDAPRKLGTWPVFQEFFLVTNEGEFEELVNLKQASLDDDHSVSSGRGGHFFPCLISFDVGRYNDRHSITYVSTTSISEGDLREMVKLLKPGGVTVDAWY